MKTYSETQLVISLTIPGTFGRGEVTKIPLSNQVVQISEKSYTLRSPRGHILTGGALISFSYEPPQFGQILYPLGILPPGLEFGDQVAPQFSHSHRAPLLTYCNFVAISSHLSFLSSAFVSSCLMTSSKLRECVLYFSSPSLERVSLSTLIN